MHIDRDTFREAMSHFASGVTVVTTVYDGALIGVTASSFSSLSLEPPLVLVSLNKRLFTHQVIAESGCFAINVLGADQQALGLRFAGIGPGAEDRFAGVATEASATGCPLLPDALAWFDCTVWNTYDGGDHTIFVGEVLAAHASGRDTPLLYHNRLWRRSEALDEPSLPALVTLIEVGLRDGIQTQTTFIPTDRKLALIAGLVAAGLRHIQVTSFVHPRLVPQLADADELCRRLPQQEDVCYSALVLNMKGLQRAREAGIRHVDMGVPVSETLSMKNANSTVAEGMARMAAMVDQARKWDMRVRAGVQAAFGCVYEGQPARSQVVDLARRFLALGIDELTLADSAGMGNPQQVRRTVQEIRQLAGDTPIVMHLHDTRGMGLANALAALKSGITHFDTSLGGLGGCPFIAGATGNIATEDTAHMLHEMGIATGLPAGIEVAKVTELSRKLAAFLNVPLEAKMATLEAAGSADSAIQARKRSILEELGL